MEIGTVRDTVSDNPTFMGIVVATEIKSGKELWRQRNYRVAINPLVEEDVQWIFIYSLVAQERTLAITNERGAHFLLNLETKEVTETK